MLFNAPDGRIVLYYKVGENDNEWYTKYVVSYDKGESWTTPKELVPGDIGGRGPVKNKPIVLHDGTWLAPASLELNIGMHLPIFPKTMENGTASSLVPLNHDKFVVKDIQLTKGNLNQSCNMFSTWERVQE